MGLGKWKVEYKWKNIRKLAQETYENFFLRYELIKDECEVYSVDIGSIDTRGRHLFQALGMTAEQVERVLQHHGWKYPET